MGECVQMPAKKARSAPRPSSGLPEVTVAVRIVLLPCRKAGKPRVFTEVRESSGESRMTSALGVTASPPQFPWWNGRALRLVQNRGVLHLWYSESGIYRLQVGAAVTSRLFLCARLRAAGATSQAISQINMTAWPAPVIHMFLGPMTQPVMAAVVSLKIH
jgi:hypothetical protein